MKVSPYQMLRLGLKSLFLQKLRAGLAALGIFIGTTTVIWLVAMGEGVSHQAQQQIKDLGATNIIARSIKPNAGDETRRQQSRQDATACCALTIGACREYPEHPPVGADARAATSKFA